MISPVTKLLRDLSDIAMNRSNDDAALNRRLDQFIGEWPTDLSIPDFAQQFSQIYRCRQKILMAGLAIFRNGNSEQQEVAREIDARMLAMFLSTTSLEPSSRFEPLPFENRAEYLQYLGRVVSAKPDPTAFVRNYLNPIEQRLIEIVETQRYNQSFSFQALEYGIGVACVALAVALTVQSTKIAHRRGLTMDYIHWLGRLLRSDMMSSWSIWDLPNDTFRSGVVLAAHQARELARVLNDSVAVALQRVIDDPLVGPWFKSEAQSNTRSG